MEERESVPLIRAVMVCVMVLLGLVAVIKGQADSWDLRNYHLYDGWEFWTGRGLRDWAAAQTQSFFNPLLSTATYLLFVNTPPWFSAFVLGALQGANVLPLHAIAKNLLPDTSRRLNRYMPLFAAVVGVTGTTQLGELGGSMGDNLVSLPLLCAYAVAFRPGGLDARYAALAGMLIGATVGIKLTTAPFALGLMVVLPALRCDGQNRHWRNSTIACASAIMAFAVTDGFWMLRLWHEFGNPLHPMFGHLFGGDFAPPFDLHDNRFFPQTFIQWLLYPLVWASSPRLVSENWFLDLRIPLAFVALLVLALRAAGEPQHGYRIRALTIALSVAYLAWLFVFSIYRYLAPLEMLSPLLIVLAFEHVAARSKWHIAVAVLVVVALTTRPFWMPRIPADSKRFLEIDVPAFPDLEHANIILAEDAPLAFLALGFPATTTFTRVGGNLMGPPRPTYGMDRAAIRRINATRGPLYALLETPDSKRTTQTLARAGLSVATPCKQVHSNLLPHDERVVLCPLQHPH